MMGHAGAKQGKSPSSATQCPAAAAAAASSDSAKSSQSSPDAPEDELDQHSAEENDNASEHNDGDDDAGEAAAGDEAVDPAVVASLPQLRSKAEMAGAATKEATERLMRDLRKIKAMKTEQEGFEVTPFEDNLYVWRVRLFGWEPNSLIGETMEFYSQATGKSDVLLQIVFPADYPRRPPFFHVIRPRFHQYTAHINSGGSICVKDLTMSGWNPEFELAPFIVMIRDLLVAGNALVNMDNLSEYSDQEAREAFVRVAKAHGWRV